jgi:RHS repeat-associated protein
MESLEERSLLTVVTLVAKDPIASEEPQSGQTDPGQFVVTRDVVTGSPLTVDFYLPSSYNPPAGYAAYSYDFTTSVYCTPDYQLGGVRGQVTIPANAASATMTITPSNDSWLEGTEKVTMTLSAGAGYAIGTPSTDTIALADNDDRWVVKMEANDLSAAERPGGQSDTGQITFTRSGSADLSSSLNVYFLLPSSYNPPTGYAAYSYDYSMSAYASFDYSIGGFRGQATIPSGSTTATVTFTPSDDGSSEGSETILVKLANTPGYGQPVYAMSEEAQAAITIADNDGSTNWQAKIEAVQATAMEPTVSGGAGVPGRFRVTRYGATDSSSAITVNYSVSGTATNGTDYTTLSGSIAIPANATEAYIDVSPSYDGLNGDNNESVILTLTSGTGYTVGSPSSGTVLIDDTGANTAADSAAATGQFGGDNDGALKLGVADTGLVWASTNDPRPIISADVKLQPTSGQATLTTVEASVTLGGVQSGTVYYDGSTANGTDLYRFSLQVDASSLATGRYDWSMTVTQRYSDQSSQTDTYTGQRDVANRATSPFGKSWSLGWLDRLYQNSRGVLLVRGDSSTAFFATSATISGRYEPEAGHPEFNVLTGNTTDGFTLVYRDGSREKFNASGILTSAIDALNNTTTYSYTDADSDGQTDDPTQVADPWHRTITFSYTSGRLSTITDFASRATTLGYDGSGRLTSVTLPDPDGGGELTSPVWEFGYNSTTSLLTSQTDPNDDTTEFAYDTARTLTTVTHADDTTDTLQAVQVLALVDTSTGEGTENDPAGLFRVADIEGSRLDALEHELTFTTGRFGMVTSSTDDAGNQSVYAYNDHGQVTTVTAPDPDGEGELTSPVTEYDYDSNGNLIQITFPDDSTQTWTYNTTFNKPTSFTDELGRETIFTLDPLTGDTLSIRQVVGEVDSPQNQETDDVVTSYTYTTRPATSSDPPAGLVATMTDPLGRITRYSYNSHGLTTMIVYAAGTADQAVVQYGYNSSDDMTSYTDELGRTTTYAYDNLHRVTCITQPDPDGEGPLSAPVTSYEYDAAGRVTKITDPLSRETQYTYDDLGRTTRVSRPDHDGDEVRTNTDYTYTYTDTGKVETVTDPLGRVTTYAYDDLDRLISVTMPDPDGEGPLASPVIEHAYDNLGRLIQETDALDRVTTYEYNSRGWMTKITQPDPDGEGDLTAPVWRYGYDAVGNLTSETDPLGNVTTRAYDELNRLVTLTQPDPDGEGDLEAPVTEYEYDKAGNQTSVTDPLLRVTTYTYDNRNRQTSRTLPDPDGEGGLSSPVYYTSYDAAGQVVSETDPLGNVTSYLYDNLGRRTRMTQPDPDGGGALTAPVTEYAYDAVGNLTSITDPLDHVTEREYDALNNLVVVTQPDPDGEGGLTSAVTEYAYDAAGNRTSERDPLNNVTQYEYDNLNRQSNVTDAELGETTYTYDAVGNRLTLTDPVGNTTTWVYDGLNRVTEETNELDDSRLFLYDAIGHLTKRTDRNGRVIQYTFDNLGRQTAELWKDGQTTIRTISFEYDAASQLTSVSDADADYTYIYDDLGRTTAIVVTIAGLTPSVGIEQAFDAAGNRTQAAFAFGTTDDMVNDYTFDHIGRMTRIEQSGQQGGNAVAEKRIDLAYDAASRWDTITRYADLAANYLVAESSWTYDNASRLTALTHVKDTTTLADYSWTYDSAGRITQFVSATDGTVDYTHDDTNQLTGADYDYQTDESYSYDANGNRTNTGYATGSDNRLTSDGTYTYTHDAEGNRTARFVDNDSSGTLNTGDTDITEYTWDYRNRLTNVTERSTYGGSATKATDFAYDHQNRLIAESADPDGAGEQSAAETYFAYDGSQIALEFDGSESADLAHRYLWGPAVDQILADEEVTSLNNPGDVLWPLTDNLGTVRDLATYDSQQDETTIANHRVFDAYGNVTSETTSAVDHLFAFTGRQFDKPTGLQNNLHRWYDPLVGRWLTQDPIGFDAADENLYRYVRNHPTMATDPFGLAENENDGPIGWIGQPEREATPYRSSTWTNRIRWSRTEVDGNGDVSYATYESLYRCTSEVYKVFQKMRVWNPDYLKEKTKGMMYRRREADFRELARQYRLAWYLADVLPWMGRFYEEAEERAARMADECASIAQAAENARSQMEQAHTDKMVKRQFMREETVFRMELVSTTLVCRVRVSHMQVPPVCP